MNRLRPLILSALALVCILFLLGRGANETSSQTLSAKDISFSFGQTSPTTLLIDKSKNFSLEELNLALSFKNNDPTFSYGNLFQTSSSIGAIRIELQQPNKLLLILGDDHIFLIAENLKPGELYSLEIQFQKNSLLKVMLNGKEHLKIADPAVLGLKFPVDHFVVGTGFSLQRTFNGSIESFTANGHYLKPTILAQIMQWLIIPTCLLGFVWLLLTLNNINFNSFKILTCAAKTKVASIRMNSLFARDSFGPIYLYPITMLGLALAIGLMKHANQQYFGMLKWIPYLLLPIPLLLLAINNIAFKQQSYKTIKVLFIALIGYLGYEFYLIYNANELNRYLFLFFSITTISTLFFIRKNYLINTFVSLASWLTIFELLNWRALAKSLHDSPFPTIIFSCISILFIWVALSPSEFIKNFKPLRISNNSKYLNTSNALIFIGLLLFFFLSFRIDSLFIPGSEYHWEYFVGPIRTIRDGGWLLYDAPSQYGFLNILLASLIPTQSAWQAFYLFQSTILFFSSALVLITLTRLSGKNLPLKMLVLLLVGSSFFFADPAWIGPQPFPSSSVVRFFCCYLLVICMLISPENTFKKIFLASAWCFGILWSAESSVYCTVIYAFAITADALQEKSLASVLHSLKTHITSSGSLFLSVLAGITIFYLIKLGHYPDFLSFYSYALGYASGYGYVPFPLNGPGNILVLLFLGLGFLTLMVMRNREDSHLAMTLAGACGCIWAIGSYYLGRPVNQNIIAIFPLLTFCSLLGILLLRQKGRLSDCGPLISVAIPIHFLILATFYSPSWWNQVGTLKAFSLNISSQLPKASDTLNAAIKEMDPKDAIPRIFFGDGAVAPRLMGDLNLAELTWAPAPLQLLMPPISNKTREGILKRYLCRNSSKQTILIYQPGSVSKDFPQFLNAFDPYLQLEGRKVVGLYEILLFSKKQNSSCESATR